MSILAINRDDSNRAYKTYANSHLIFFLEANTFKCLHNGIETHLAYLVFWIFLFDAYALEIWVKGMTYYLSDSLLTLVNCFIFTSDIYL